MKLTFRQGIARYQTDVLSTPTFLQKSTGGGTWIDLVVSPDPTVIVFAQRSANYIFEEPKTIYRAWGPFVGTQTVYLFWDVNFVTGELTRGSTIHPPLFTGTAPATPFTDQHWFDTNEAVMRVWDGTKWIERIRVFAAFLSSGSIIRAYPLGSQAGIVGDHEGGNLILDAYNKPLRQSDGSFVTTVTNMLIVNNSSKKVKFEAEVVVGMAAEPIPKFHLVQMRAGRRIVMNRSGNFMSRISGLVLEDLHTNEVGMITTEGLVRNEGWSFPADKVGRPVFCGANGEVTLTPPTSGVVQSAGFVEDTDSIYMNIQMPIILTDVTTFINPPPIPAPALAPIPSFNANVTTGVAPLSVLFTNSSSNSPTSFEWDFTNDGTVDDTVASPVYQFAAPGVYTVRLRASNSFGAVEEIKQNYITVTSAPPPTSTQTNLGIRLGGPAQVVQNKQFQISVTIENDGFLTATAIERVLTIPDVRGNQIAVSGLPAGSTAVRNGSRLIVTLPSIGNLGTGLTYGPEFITILAPPKSGSIAIYASVRSPEADSTPGDNSTSLLVEVRPS